MSGLAARSVTKPLKDPTAQYKAYYSWEISESALKQLRWHELPNNCHGALSFTRNFKYLALREPHKRRTHTHTSAKCKDCSGRWCRFTFGTFNPAGEPTKSQRRLWNLFREIRVQSGDLNGNGRKLQLNVKVVQRIV